MKLFTRYFRINLVATLVIFLLASIAFYFLLWWVMIAQVDEDLKIEQREIETYVGRYRHPPEPISVKDQRISFAPTDIKMRMHDFHTVRSQHKREAPDFREIRFTLPTGDQWYEFRVAKSLEGTQDMNRSIILISLLTMILILLVSLLINRWLIRRLWKPFYTTISEIRNYQLGGKKMPDFENTSIEEFRLLNKTLGRFITDAEKEYKLLKEFTENASHELQTPLAIVQTKLDTLIQDENLSESQSHAAQKAYEAIQKLSKLNQSLLLLSKIENNQFSQTSSFDFKPFLEEKLIAWQELWQGRQLLVTQSLESTEVQMNRQLADILVNNLFSNALRHSPEMGTVSVELKNRQFVISNSASGTGLDGEKIFERFTTGGQESDHYGLGLSIVKQISEVAAHPVSYSFVHGMHIFIVEL